MRTKFSRRTVDLTGFPDLVAIYLGMRVNAMTGLRTVIGFGPKIARSVDARPEGLLLHENMIFSLFPLHVDMRQYWHSFEALETWARSEPHRTWWQQFLRNSGGTGFWHEAYFMRGGMVKETGFLRFAPISAARGPMFSARGARSSMVRRSGRCRPTSLRQFQGMVGPTKSITSLLSRVWESE